MRYGLAYKDVADWQVEWKHTNAEKTKEPHDHEDDR